MLSTVYSAAWSHVWVVSSSQEVQLWLDIFCSSRHIRHNLVTYYMIKYPKPFCFLSYALNVLFSMRLLGTRGWLGVSTLMHLCSQTDDTPPDLSVHLPPQSRFTALFSTALFARGALFPSVLNELNGLDARSAAHSTYQIQQHVCISAVYGQKFGLRAHVCLRLIQSDGFWFSELCTVDLYFNRSSCVNVMIIRKKILILGYNYQKLYF